MVILKIDDSQKHRIEGMKPDTKEYTSMILFI